MTEPRTALNGFLLLDKPVGPTSHDVVAELRRITGERVIGHAGTLDPAAGGLLILALGPATRLLEYLSGLPKDYECAGRLGFRSSTDDAQGDIQPVEHPRAPTREELERALSRLRGAIMQRPPAFSARKLAGRRAYQLARSGADFELPAAPVLVRRLECVNYQYPDFQLTMSVSAGAYVRSIVRDLGDALNTGAYTLSINRTAIGPHTLDHALALDALRSGKIAVSAALREPGAVLSWLRRIRLDPRQARRVAHGNAVTPAPERLPETPLPADQPLLIYDEADRLLAVGALQAGGAPGGAPLLIPRKVFPVEQLDGVDRMDEMDLRDATGDAPATDDEHRVDVADSNSGA